MPKIFISAAELSADSHGAGLIEAVRKVRPDVQFMGIPGPRMREAGCKALFELASRASMLLGIVRNIRAGRRLLAQVKSHFRDSRPDTLVVIDSPVLHLPMARLAKRHGIPVLYYAAPQLWAWGEWRVGKLRRRTDEVAVILPFEEAFFRNRGIRATFVGHPLFDRLPEPSSTRSESGAQQGHSGPRIALLPGSRRHVVQEVLPGQLEVAERIRSEFPGASAMVSVAIPELRSEIEAIVRNGPGDAEVHQDDVAGLLGAADLALVASGTATLEVAHFGTPMVVMYNGSRWLYHLVGRWLIKTQYLSLINILAGREVVPEFMPYYVSTQPIAEAALRILRSDSLRDQMRRELAEVIEPLRTGNASERTAELLLDMLDRAAAAHNTKRPELSA